MACPHRAGHRGAISYLVVAARLCTVIGAFQARG
jgi:hypothetical protein